MGSICMFTITTISSHFLSNLEEGTSEVRIFARGETDITSKSVVSLIPYFESLLSGGWKQGEGISIYPDSSVLNVFVS